jgi:hypothetical protein
VPVLAAPDDDFTLPNLTPRFVWSYGDLHGVDQFLICITARGVACPTAPTLQPYVFAAPVQGGFEFTAPKDFAPFMGQTLQWTVAVCNAELGCSYQPAARRFRVPVLTGSFDAVYAIAQNEKCKNCHQMRDGNETYQRHVRLGRFTQQAVPPQNVGNSALCESCHTRASGFTDAWRAPVDTPSFDVPISDQFCMVMQSAPFGSNASEHLMLDGRILWAAAHIQGLGEQGWHDVASAWYNFNRKNYWSAAPCLCKGKWDCGGRSHGQFTP